MRSHASLRGGFLRRNLSPEADPCWHPCQQSCCQRELGNLHRLGATSALLSAAGWALGNCVIGFARGKSSGNFLAVSHLPCSRTSPSFLSRGSARGFLAKNDGSQRFDRRWRRGRASLKILSRSEFTSWHLENDLWDQVWSFGEPVLRA